MAEVALTGVVKSFGGEPVLRGVDVLAPDGALTVLLGPSGCGKTTILRVVVGLEDVDSGEVRIGGRRVNALPPKRRDVAMVFQSYALYPHMTVAENLAFALRMAGIGRVEADRRVRRAARLLEIEELLGRRPKQLSGGQQQRVAMGRAMVREPAVYLFDEPLSNLDARLRAQMRLEIARLQRDLGTTMIYVTHDQVEAMTLADRVVLLDRGRVAQAGPPLEIYRRPANLFVAGFIGSPPMNLYATRILGGERDGVAVALPNGAALALPVVGAAAGAPVTLGIRPEHIGLGDAAPAGAATLAAIVAAVERLGAETHVMLEAGDLRLVARADGDAPIGVGDRLAVHLPPGRCHLFDAAGDVLARTD